MALSSTSRYIVEIIQRDGEWKRSLDGTLCRTIISEGKDKLILINSTTKTSIEQYCVVTGSIENSKLLCRAVVETDDNVFVDNIAELVKTNLFVNDINNIHPEFIKCLLHRFGFLTCQIYDKQSQLFLQKVETLEHWLSSSINNKFLDINTRNKLKVLINDSSHLEKCLTSIIEYVNNNPAIFNPNYVTSDHYYY